MFKKNYNLQTVTEENMKTMPPALNITLPLSKV